MIKSFYSYYSLSSLPVSLKEVRPDTIDISVANCWSRGHLQKSLSPDCWDWYSCESIEKTVCYRYWKL